ncbi:MAG: hypothetical protein BMS9Abin34_206 [Patescibacteria group bacterium]|nr:MAG: hypothetical protein BMS9Abin34_206 [Patescibacteria group bacterium]
MLRSLKSILTGLASRDVNRREEIVRKKRRIHVCPPATAIRKALRITKADVKAAKDAIAAAIGEKSR